MIHSIIFKDNLKYMNRAETPILKKKTTIKVGSFYWSKKTPVKVKSCYYNMNIIP